MKATIQPRNSWVSGAQVLAFAGLVVGCDFPIPASKYEMRETTLTDLDPLDSFANGDANCRAQLETACRDDVDRCTGTLGCVDFTGCVREVSTPAAEAACSSKLNASLEAQWAYERLRGCWAKEYSACAVGKDWRCIDGVEGYGRPASEARPYFYLSQQLKYLDSELDGDPLSIQACGLGLTCTPIAQTQTDGAGEYTVEVPMLEAIGQIWNGWRVIEGEKVPRSHVRLNIPIWGDRVEVSRIAKTQAIEEYATFTASKAMLAIFVQVLDCQSGPAADIVVEPSEGRVAYTDELRPIFGATQTLGTGAAAVFDFTPGEQIHIKARRAGDALEVATFSGRLPVGEVMYLKLYPAPRNR